ncbi:781_t:CDS:1, partial [Funneliformis caledonium]
MKEPEEPDIEESDIPVISNYEVLAALNQIIIYTEQKSDKIDFSKDQIRAIKKLRKMVERE